MTTTEKLMSAWSPAKPVLLTVAEQEALSFLLPLSEDYPNFEAWYRTRVVPGLRAGTRTLVRIERHDTLIGIGIAKRSNSERKICTVRIAASHFGRGLGLRIATRACVGLTPTNRTLPSASGNCPRFSEFSKATVSSALLHSRVAISLPLRNLPITKR